LTDQPRLDRPGGIACHSGAAVESDAMKRQPLLPLPSGAQLSASSPEVLGCFDRPEVSAVLLFGSQAAGGAHALSDVDLAYLGTNFAAEDAAFDAILEALQRTLGEGRFDLVPLRRAPLHLRFQILTEGKVLAAKDRGMLEDVTTDTIVRYLDFKPYRDAYFAGSD